MMRSCLSSLVVTFLTLALTGSSSYAQGFARPKDSVWVKFGYIYARGTENFAGFDERRWVRELNARNDTNDPIPSLGERSPFRSRSGQVVAGELFSHEATLDALYSPLDGLTLGIFIPGFRYVQYSNEVNGYRTVAARPGDPRLSASYQLTPKDQTNFGASAFARVKIPTSFVFPYSNEALAGEGQVDLSAGIASTLMLAPNVYLDSSFEYRHRRPFISDEAVAFLGDEAELNLAVGTGAVPGVWLKGGYTGMWGQIWRVRQPGEAVATARLQRSLQSVYASAYIMALGDWTGVPGLALDLWYKQPLTGTDHAVMLAGGVGVAYDFSLVK